MLPVGFVALIIDVSSHASLRSGGASVAHMNDRCRFALFFECIELKSEFEVAQQLLPVALGGSHSFELEPRRIDVLVTIRPSEGVDQRDADLVAAFAALALSEDSADWSVWEFVRVRIPPVLLTAALRHVVSASSEIIEVLSELGPDQVESTTDSTLAGDQTVIF